MDPGILEINFKTHYQDPLHNECRYKFRSMLVNSGVLLVVLVASGTATRNVYTYPQREILIGVTITVGLHAPVRGRGYVVYSGD